VCPIGSGDDFKQTLVALEKKMSNERCRTTCKQIAVRLASAATFDRPRHGDTDTASDENWDELLLYIHNRQVIPVIGPELLTRRKAAANCHYHAG
jgi:hypothetical protein